MGNRKRKKNKIPPKYRLPRVTSTSLEEKIVESGLFGEEKVKVVRGLEEKMSDVLLDFAQPILHGIEGDLKATERAISFAAAVWNLSLPPKGLETKALQDILGIIGGDCQDMRNEGENIVRMLLDRKAKLYPRNKRYIINYEFGMRNGQPWLNVASTLG